MTTAVANSQDQGFRQFLIYSIIMHASLAVVIIVSAYIQYHGKAWGGVGGNLGGTKVSLVSAAGIPMPKESVVTESKTPTPDNAVPYGKGGNPDLPTGYSPTPGDGSSGVTVQGQGGADFASRYGWYIEAVKNRIYGNWQQWTIDAAARASRTMHCAITFTINRDGSLKDVHIAESSGNTSYDSAALHAVVNTG